MSSTPLLRAALSLAGLGLLTPAATAQQPGAVPPRDGVFPALMGEWGGEGTLLGRPARFTMRWTHDPRGFYLLAFDNGFVDSTGALRPVLSALAIYRPKADSAVGVWVDSRPLRLELAAVVSDSVIRTEWTAAAERGWTVYRLEADGRVAVVDTVMTGAGRREFGRASYVRRR